MHRIRSLRSRQRKNQALHYHGFMVSMATTTILLINYGICNEKYLKLYKGDLFALILTNI